MQAELDVLKNKPNMEREERLFEDVSLAAFLYVRATDSWKALNDELGLRPNFDEEIAEFILSLDLMEAKEKLMRKMAFSETEASPPNQLLKLTQKSRTANDGLTPLLKL